MVITTSVFLEIFIFLFITKVEVETGESYKKFYISFLLLGKEEGVGSDYSFDGKNKNLLSQAFFFFFSRLGLGLVFFLQI